MKIAVLNESKQTIGGGFSFIDNFYTGILSFNEHSIVAKWEDADIVLIPSASMVSKETFYLLKSYKKKIVLRVDNIPRNSRNRGTGTSRLKAMADGSDLVIFQSQWAKDYISPFLGKGGQVIYNGIDTSVFTNKGAFVDFKGHPTYLYSRFNRDETKRWEWAWYRYQQIQRQEPNALLVLVGQFSDEQRQYNFDFYNNEKVKYMGVIDDPKMMANIYRGCNYLIACYSNDCYSNTYQEGLACGIKLFEPDMTGGTPELIKNGVIDCRDMVGNYLKVFKAIL